MLTLAIDDSSDDPEYRRALRSARLFMTVTWVRPHGQAAAGPRAAQLHAEGHSLAAANSPSARRRRCRSRRSRRAQGAAVAHRVARLADCDPGGVAAGLPAPHIPHGRGGPRARPAPPPRDQAQPRRGRASSKPGGAPAKQHASCAAPAMLPTAPQRRDSEAPSRTADASRHRLRGPPEPCQPAPCRVPFTPLRLEHSLPLPLASPPSPFNPPIRGPRGGGSRGGGTAAHAKVRNRRAVLRGGGSAGDV